MEDDAFELNLEELDLWRMGEGHSTQRKLWARAGHIPKGITKSSEEPEWEIWDPAGLGA